MSTSHYTFDYSKSKELFKKYHLVVEPKMCYNNVFHVACHEMLKLKAALWKIAYGYISLDEGNRLYGRHCFFLDGNTVIDPTIIANHETEEQHRDYLVFKVFETFDEYMQAINREEKHFPALENTLRKTDFEFCAEQNKKGKFFIS